MSGVWREEEGAEPAVLVEIADGIGTISLNRPDKMNAWSPSLGTQYFDALDRCAADPEVRVILVRGNGRAFCAGADMSGLSDVVGAGELGELADKRPYWHAMTIGKPIVAAIHGACVGVGFYQAICCDVRFASADARLAAIFSRVGLVAETGIGWNLTRLAGAGATMDMLLSGRLVAAEEALRLGLVAQVVDGDKLIEAATAYCRTLADKCSPWSMRIVKQQVYADMMSNIGDAYARSERLLAEAFAGPDFAEGVNAFLEKRPTAFPPLPAELARFDITG